MKPVAHDTRKLRVDIEEKRVSYSAKPKPIRQLYDIVCSPERDERNFQFLLAVKEVILNDLTTFDGHSMPVEG